MKGMFILLITYIWISGVAIVTSTAQETCNRHILGRLEGSIKSPNFPFNYRNNLECKYSIHLPHVASSVNRTLCFVFHRFDLEDTDRSCQHDFVFFTDLTHSYCGQGAWNAGKPTNQLGNVFSSNFCIPTKQGIYDILFKTDSTQTYSGFYATFQIHTEGYQQDYIATKCTAVCPPFDPWKNCPNYKLCFHGHQRDQCGCQTCQCLPAVNAPCGNGNVTCFNRKCIPQSKLCDGEDSCGDQSDELWAHARCPNKFPTIAACNFERSKYNIDGFCNIRIHGTVDGTWQRQSRQLAENAPSADHTLGDEDGFYLSTAFHAESAPLSKIRFSGYTDVATQHDHCLGFWYHMRGADMGSLDVYIHDTGGASVGLSAWYREDQQGVYWLEALVDVPAGALSSVQLMVEWEATKGSLAYPRIAVDDISVLRGPCSGDDISCTFELGTCGWTQQLYRNDFPWIRSQGTAGKLHDHRGPGGWFLIANTTNSHGHKGRIVSRAVSAREEAAFCLRFWYTMQSWSRHDSLRIYTIGEYVEERRLIWEAQDMNRSWHKIQTDFRSGTGPFQIVIEAYVFTRFQTAPIIAIDDIVLVPETCDLGSTVTTPKPCTDFLCNNGRCVLQKETCDGVDTCGDGSDEDPRICKTNAVKDTSLPLGAVIGISLSCIIVFFIIVANICYCRYYKCNNSDRQRVPRTSQRYVASTNQQQSRSRFWPWQWFRSKPTDDETMPAPLREPPPYSSLPPSSNSIHVSCIHHPQTNIPEDLPPPYSMYSADNPAYTGSTLTITFQPSRPQIALPQEPPPAYSNAVYAIPTIRAPRRPTNDQTLAVTNLQHMPGTSTAV